MKRIAGRRGQVLVHVLVTGVIVMILATGIARMLLMRYYAEARVEDGGAKRRLGESAIAEIQTAWSAANTVCAATPAGSLVTRATGAAGSCTNCTYTGTDALSGDAISVAAAVSGSGCSLNVTVTSPASSAD